MTSSEITGRALEGGLLSDKLTGKTPHHSMRARLSEDIRTRGSASLFTRTKAGTFTLRERLSPGEKPYEGKRHEPAKENERVATFPAELLNRLGRVQGITRRWHSTLKTLLRPDTIKYIERAKAEETEEYKQIVSYVLVTRGNQVLRFRRGSFNRVADFLRGVDCLGFGGHLAERDATLLNRSDLGLFDCAARELGEELALPKPDLARLSARKGFEIWGLLNDDSSPVGRRHFAVLFKYEVSNDKAWDVPKRGEKSITTLQWINPHTSTAPFWELEYWSQLCVRSLFKPTARILPGFRRVTKRPPKTPHYLCVIGPVGCGKSEVTRVLKEDFGYEELNSGQILAGLLKIPPVPRTPRARPIQPICLCGAHLPLTTDYGGDVAVRTPLRAARHPGRDSDGQW